MCGICGIVNLSEKPAEEVHIRAMMNQMKHRGPDDEGVFISENVGLGFVRLSIIDLSPTGNQPMFSDDGNYVMVFNGEIYNYIEIREELITKGYIFRTKSDSEVLLKAYQEWKEECLYKFNGMWSFVIYNKSEKSIFASRDRFGVKPFYYYSDNDIFIFASEIQPILKVLPVKPRPDYQTIFDYLVFNRTDQTDITFFSGIRKLQHGHKLSLHNFNVEICKWYDLRSSLKEPFSSPEEYREMLTSSIKLRLRSDVPVGVCLSGGLDSSSIVSLLLNKFKKRDLNTFSAIYQKGQRGDESEYISEYRDLISNRFFITPTGDSLYTDLQSFITAHGEPVPTTSPYAQFKVMQLAKGNVVVTLDGQGADEQLAGYHYFFGLYFKDLLRHRKLSLLSKEIRSYHKLHHSWTGLMSFLFFLLPEGLKTDVRILGKKSLQYEFVKKYKKSNSVSANIYSSESLNESLLDHFEFKLEHLLKWEDRNSMWFSLEARVPFLDYRLVEKTLPLNGEWLIKNGINKTILREAMKDILPEKIRTRNDKIGFSTPQDEWFKNDLIVDLFKDIIHSDSFRSRGIFNQGKALVILNKHISGQTNASSEIWKWINLELWFRNFIDD